MDSSSNKIWQTYYPTVGSPDESSSSSASTSWGAFNYLKGCTYLDKPFCTPPTTPSSSEDEDEPTPGPSKPLTDEERAELIRLRNADVIKYYSKNLEKQKLDHYPVLTLENIEKGRIKFEDDASYVERIEQMAERCFKETKEVTIDKLDEDKVYEQRFDYYDFQLGLKVQFLEDQLEYLEKSLEMENPVPMTVPDHATLKKEFKRMYGPIKANGSRMLEYLKNYKEYREEHIEETKRKLSIGETYGKAEVLKLINYYKEELNSLREQLPHGGGTNLHEIYDVNPYTNRTHSDWFLIDRPAMPRECLVYIRHPSLENTLTEYKVPENLVALNGYWPTLTDYTLVYYSQMLVPVDPLERYAYTKIIQKEKEGPKEEQEDSESVESVGCLLTEDRFKFWTCLGSRIIQEIKDYPLGVELETFFDMIQRKYNYLKGLDFFPHSKFNLEIAVCEYMTSIIHFVKIPGMKEGKHIVILYPVFMRGVVKEDGSTTMMMMKRIWSRILFMVQKRGGNILLSDVPKLYTHMFQANLSMGAWGFKTRGAFAQWCINQWGKENWYKVRVERQGGLGSALVHYEETSKSS